MQLHINRYTTPSSPVLYVGPQSIWGPRQTPNKKQGREGRGYGLAVGLRECTFHPLSFSLFRLANLTYKHPPPPRGGLWVKFELTAANSGNTEKEANLTCGQRRGRIIEQNYGVKYGLPPKHLPFFCLQCADRLCYVSFVAPICGSGGTGQMDWQVHSVIPKWS